MTAQHQSYKSYKDEQITVEESSEESQDEDGWHS